MSTLGSRLKKARERKKLTQMDAAKIIGISNGTLSGYERNYRDPDTPTLSRLAELYEVSTDWLTGVDQKREVDPDDEDDDIDREIAKELKSVSKEVKTNFLALLKGIPKQ